MRKCCHSNNLNHTCEVQIWYNYVTWAISLGTLRNQGNDYNSSAILPLFLNFTFNKFPFLLTNLLPLRDHKVDVFNYTIWKSRLWSAALQTAAWKAKFALFKCLLSQKKDASIVFSWRRFRLGSFYWHVKVTVGNYIWLLSYKRTI